MKEHESPRGHELQLRHLDGRAVMCSVLGARDFKNTVFYSHGFPACRIEATVAHREALERGITIIAVDRPGFGGSDWYRGRRFEDWASDVRLVADHLKIATFGVLGVSGGTPTAIAAAALLTDRVTSLGIVSGIAPVQAPGAIQGMNIANKLLLRLGVACPWLGTVIIGIVALIWRTFPLSAKVWFGALLPTVDRQIVTRREVGLVLAKNIREALRQGTRGVITEYQLFTSDWTGLLTQVQVPTVIWHGDSDTYVPVSMGETLKKNISGSVFHKVPGGGHFMIIDRLSSILGTFS